MAHENIYISEDSGYIIIPGVTFEHYITPPVSELSIICRSYSTRKKNH